MAGKCRSKGVGHPLAPPLGKVPFTTLRNSTERVVNSDVTLSDAPYPVRTKKGEGKHMTKFTIAASVAVFMLGAIVGRATAPTPAMAAALAISIDELTRNAGPLPVESFDAI
jgi:hypothetical protein